MASFDHYYKQDSAPMSIDITTLNVIDYVIIVTMVVSALMSMLRGMTRELLGLVGWPLAIFSTYFAQPIVKPIITKIVVVESISQALSLALPFAIVVVLWFVIASMLSPSLKRAGLRSLDRWLGMFFGFIRGYIIVILIYTVASVVIDGDEYLPEEVKNSVFTPYIQAGSIALAHYAPKDYRERIKTNITTPANSVVEEHQNKPGFPRETASGVTNDTARKLDNKKPNNLNLLEDEATSQ